VPRKPTDPAPTVASIIRAARGKNTQDVFAAELGITQDRLSKYENGRTNPPAPVIEKCLKIVHDRQSRDPPNVHAIARQVETTLDGSENAELRRALALLLDHLLPNTQTAARRVR
jgi:transcriptional regulator with XRE-family HTH domain